MCCERFAVKPVPLHFAFNTHFERATPNSQSKLQILASLGPPPQKAPLQYNNYNRGNVWWLAEGFTTAYN